MPMRGSLVTGLSALLISLCPMAAEAGEQRTDGDGGPVAFCDPADIEQIGGNVQATHQTGSENTASVAQHAVASGQVPGANVAVIVQDGTGNDAAIGQHGEGLNASIAQFGAAHSAAIDQSGAGLGVRIEQFGESAGAQVTQSGIGSGTPIVVRQY